MIVTCSLDPIHVDETIGTLRFGERAQNVCNYIRADRRTTRAILADLENQIQSDAEQLVLMKSRGNDKLKSYAAMQEKYFGLRQQYADIIERSFHRYQARNFKDPDIG